MPCEQLMFRVDQLVFARPEPDADSASSSAISRSTRATSRNSLRAGPGFSRRASVRKSFACKSRADVPCEICMCAMVSLHRDHRCMFGRSRQQAGGGADLVDPGFPSEPVVIGPTNRAAGVRKENGAAPKALAIGLDAGRDRASGLRTPDHDHAHVSLPWI